MEIKLFGKESFINVARMYRKEIKEGLVAFAVSLDRDGVKFGLGDNGNLGVEVDAKIEFSDYFILSVFE